MIARVDDRLLRTAQAFFGAYLITKMSDAERLDLAEHARKVALKVSNSRDKPLDEIVDESIGTYPLDVDILRGLPEFYLGLLGLGYEESCGAHFVHRLMYRIFEYAHPNVPYSYALPESMGMCEALILGRFTSQERADLYDGVSLCSLDRSTTVVMNNGLWRVCLALAHRRYPKEMLGAVWGDDLLMWARRLDRSNGDTYEVHSSCVARIAYKMACGDIAR